MNIRPTKESDLVRIEDIYTRARSFMAANGNPTQWGPTQWPPMELIADDIHNGSSFVCVDDSDTVIGTFAFFFGRDIEPTYRTIHSGAWLDESPYGVIHRLASDGTHKGVAAFCINRMYEQCGHLRIDTHTDNVIMQNIADKLGFTRCGIIYVEKDNYPRIAYEKSRLTEQKG